MKTPLLTIISLFFFFGCAEKDENSKEYKGLSFFLTDDTMVTAILNIESVQPEDEPFICYNEIISYDSSSHILKLNHSVGTMFSSGQIVDRRGFVAMLDATRIYCGVFYSPIHSQPNPNIVITMSCNEPLCDSCLQIIEGYPNDDYYTGYSNVNDPRIIELLDRDNKLR